MTRLKTIPHDGPPAAVDPSTILAVRAWRRGRGTDAIITTERDSLRVRWDDASEGLAALTALTSDLPCVVATDDAGQVLWIRPSAVTSLSLDAPRSPGQKTILRVGYGELSALAMSFDSAKRAEHAFDALEGREEASR